MYVETGAKFEVNTGHNSNKLRTYTVTVVSLITNTYYFTKKV